MTHEQMKASAEENIREYVRSLVNARKSTVVIIEHSAATSKSTHDGHITYMHVVANASIIRAGKPIYMGQYRAEWVGVNEWMVREQ